MNHEKETTGNGINFGAVLAILIVCGYIGFELYALHKLGYRMEAPYIFERYVAAGHAFEQCGEREASQNEQFQKKYNRAKQRAQKEFIERYPDASPDEINQKLLTLIDDRRAEIDELINNKGCEDTEIWQLLRRYKRFAS